MIQYQYQIINKQQTENWAAASEWRTTIARNDDSKGSKNVSSNSLENHLAMSFIILIFSIALNSTVHDLFESCCCWMMLLCFTLSPHTPHSVPNDSRVLRSASPSFPINKLHLALALTFSHHAESPAVAQVTSELCFCCSAQRRNQTQTRKEKRWKSILNLVLNNAMLLLCWHKS